MRTSEILNKSADIIEEKGWSTGPSSWHWEHEGQAVCLEGGMLAAIGLRWEDSYNYDDDDFDSADILRSCPAYKAVVSYLESTGRAENIRDMDGDVALWAFNDDAESADEVIEVLRAAALVEEVKESEVANVG